MFKYPGADLSLKNSSPIWTTYRGGFVNTFQAKIVLNLTFSEASFSHVPKQLFLHNQEKLVIVSHS